MAPTPFGQEGLFGGGERYPLELARALTRHIEVELVTFGREARTEIEPGGLTIRVLRTSHLLGGHPARPLAPSLAGAIRAADVVHTHHMRSTPSRLAALVARLQGEPVVTTDHGLQGGAWGGMLPRLFDSFLLVSQYSAQELGTPLDKTRVIYGGANPERFHPEPSVQRKGVLFVGRVTPHKGIDRLIEALPGGSSLRIAGSFGHDPNLPERDYPALLRRMAAGKKVEFLGPVSDSDLPELHRSAVVCVLPSVDRTYYGKTVRVSELLGLSVLEAMASGTPVIASRLGGLPETIEDGLTGHLVEPGNVEELRERILDLEGDPALAERMGRAARQRVLEHFTWEACARRCLRVYGELIGG